MDHAEWRARHLNDSPAFGKAIDDLRPEYHRRRYACRTIASMPYVDVLGLRGQEPTPDERRCDEEVLAGGNWPPEGIGAPPIRPQEAVRRARSTVQDVALRYFGATGAAPLVHELAAGTGPFDVHAIGTFGAPAPSGPIASTAAAHLTGADYGSYSARTSALSKVTRGLDPSVNACEVFTVSPAKR
jgi:hypothetical protein